MASEPKTRPTGASVELFLADQPPARQADVLAEAGIVFLFAPLYHPSLRYAGTARRELGIQTPFNFLGPLANPARPAAQAVGSTGAPGRPSRQHVAWHVARPPTRPGCGSVSASASMPMNAGWTPTVAARTYPSPRPDAVARASVSRS